MRISDWSSTCALPIYLKGRPLAPKGADWDAALAWWRTLRTDEGARFDKSVTIDAAQVEPTVTWGTSPEDVVAIGGRVPDPASFSDTAKRQTAQKSLRSEEHKSELQSLMRITYAFYCLKKKKHVE